MAQRTKTLERTRDHVEWGISPGPEQRMPTRTSGIHGGTPALSERWCEKHGRGSKFHSTGVIRQGEWFQLVRRARHKGCFRCVHVHVRNRMLDQRLLYTIEPRHVDVQTPSYMCRLAPS